MGLPAVSTRNPKPHPHPQPNPYPFLQVHSEIASSMPDLQWPKGLGRLPPETTFVPTSCSITEVYNRDTC